ncbi:unnamed protein product [Didymodactylos carnosus]|uniref:DUF1772-domain-containing protein n=1 Tax=Didymodactylos carnosus TaxID=1234261 RepID=A0A814B4A0_9BILA|nr:unnamed protein product [Didymodactylos carnosus]CAF1105785.1 unnamed protein product [Didymodactylos carnosus]CAF3703030.1 unnamed protein product [Didymodactylos carnosus]CAF3869066.1 unnamed protein product [Didymodactylos carnosus]
MSVITDNLGLIAAGAGGLFAGAALYITYGESVGMSRFGIETYWQYFPIMYRQAATGQAIFAMVSGLSGLAHAYNSPLANRNLWLTSSCIFVGMLPYTVMIVAPVNNQIMGKDKQRIVSSISEKKALLEKWAYLHLVRTVGSCVGFGLMIYGISKH